jgi:branched-chain amino acid transport system permease protein
MNARRTIVSYLIILLILYLLQFVLPPYPHSLMTRIMVFAIYASAYNLLLGFLGMISLGHSMYFGAGLYVTGLLIINKLVDPFSAIIIGVFSATLLGVATAPILLRTRGPMFIILTLMTSLAFYYAVILFNNVTGGEQGLVLPLERLTLPAGKFLIDLTSPVARYNAALLGLIIAMSTSLTIYLKKYSTLLLAIKENEDRTELLGYDVYRHKLTVFLLSSTLSGLSGSLYSITARYIGASLVSVNYSIMPLLWALLGGQGTVLGPLVGTAFLTVIIDIASSYTSSYLIIVGISLIALVLTAPEGLLGRIKTRWLRV